MKLLYFMKDIVLESLCVICHVASDDFHSRIATTGMDVYSYLTYCCSDKDRFYQSLTDLSVSSELQEAAYRFLMYVSEQNVPEKYVNSSERIVGDPDIIFFENDGLAFGIQRS